jgi:hypothetical protein
MKDQRLLPSHQSIVAKKHLFRRRYSSSVLVLAVKLLWNVHMHNANAFISSAFDRSSSISSQEATIFIQCIVHEYCLKKPGPAKRSHKDTLASKTIAANEEPKVCCHFVHCSASGPKLSDTVGETAKCGQIGRVCNLPRLSKDTPVLWNGPPAACVCRRV